MRHVLHNVCHCSAAIRFYDLITHTCNEIKQVQPKQHMAYLPLGVVNRRGQTKAGSVVFVALIKHLEVKIHLFFTIMLATH